MVIFESRPKKDLPCLTCGHEGEKQDGIRVVLLKCLNCKRQEKINQILK